ncbi:MAG TPA: hypothetical protein VKT29_09940, partial [Terriglobales bacterium]|nr:hypothetical protein [Terriglobales bacterium]
KAGARKAGGLWPQGQATAPTWQKQVREKQAGYARQDSRASLHRRCQREIHRSFVALTAQARLALPQDDSR